MMGEAQAAGLVLRPEAVSQTRRIANAYGPMHDSRSGLGSYYRYQPRNVGAYIVPPAPGTENMRDPEYPGQGIGHRPWVDKSVLCRIHAGTDGYAPITLPGSIAVVGNSDPRNRLPADLQQCLDRSADDRTDRQEALRDIVWWRRVLYFLIVAATLALAVLPLVPEERVDPFCGDSRCYLSTAFGWWRAVLPEFAEPWIAAFQRLAGITTALIVAIFLFRGVGTALERFMRDRTRIVWSESIAGTIEAPKLWAPIRPLRTSAAYQLALKALKWWILPFVFGFGMLLALVWAAVALIGQVHLAAGENGDLFCSRSNAEGPLMAADAPCNRLGINVQRGKSYEVDLHVRDDWFDGSERASPLGLSALDLGPVGIGGAPFRRVVGAKYMQPLIEIELPQGARAFDEYRRVHIRSLDVRHVSGKHFRARFVAPRDGALSIFANEAVLPFVTPTFFYSGPSWVKNRGTACVGVSRISGPKREAITSCPEAQQKKQEPRA
jgi:hypothetical protein